MHFIVWQFLEIYSMSLNKNHFCLASVYHHLLSAQDAIKDNLPKDLNKMMQCKNTQVISKTKAVKLAMFPLDLCN